jgi:hypothetical protein
VYFVKGVDIVIALTHMRWPNDRKLAENVDEIDLILGGHDHDYNVEMVISTNIYNMFRVRVMVFNAIQYYVIKFVSDLWQVGGFLRSPPPIKLTATK